jgi:hypothetical protein
MAIFDDLARAAFAGAATQPRPASERHRSNRLTGVREVAKSLGRARNTVPAQASGAALDPVGLRAYTFLHGEVIRQ